MNEVTKRNLEEAMITSHDLLSFISCSATNVGRSTFYNMSEEQKQEMMNQHLPVFTKARGFYALMMLPDATNDVNKSMIAYHLVANTLRKEGLRDNEHDEVTKWENEVIMQVLNNMQPNRVFDLFERLVDNKISNKRTLYVIHRWLKEHNRSWELWAVKYRKPFKRVLRHVHNGLRNKDNELSVIWRYLKYDETENCGQIIQDYKSVQKGDKNALMRLPITVAEGFLNKFGIDKSSFTKKFTSSEGGGKLTNKEKKLRDNQIKKAEGTSQVNLSKLSLWDLLVYLRGVDTYPLSIGQIQKLLENKAKKIASKLSFNFKNAGVIIDTSVSMAGTKEEAFHPMLRAIAMGMVFKYATEGTYKAYWTSSESKFKGLFPKLQNQSNYADAVLQALKDGCEQIIIIGDGYENAPFEGALHQLLFTYKKKIDVDDKVTFLHFNPVFSSESGDVRILSDIAGHIGIRDLKALDESVFLAVARTKPMEALMNYAKRLIELQNNKAKGLMPESVKRNLSGSAVRNLLT